MEFSSLSLTQFSADWIILVAIAGIIALDAYRSGPARAIAVSLALPFAAILKDALSSAALLSGAAASFSDPALQAGLFILFFVGAFFLVHRMTYSFGDGAGSILSALLVGIAATAMMTVLWVNTPALDAVWHFSAIVQTIFGAAYKFWWMLLALSALAFARG